jgi:hypothetical protein
MAHGTVVLAGPEGQVSCTSPRNASEVQSKYVCVCACACVRHACCTIYQEDPYAISFEIESTFGTADR